MPTSVEGSKVGRLKLSTCWRFSLVRRPAGRPSTSTCTVAALTTRLSASYCEIPTWVNRYVWPNGLRSSTDSPGLSVASRSTLKAIPANAAK